MESEKDTIHREVETLLAQNDIGAQEIGTKVVSLLKREQFPERLCCDRISLLDVQKLLSICDDSTMNWSGHYLLYWDMFTVLWIFGKASCNEKHIERSCAHLNGLIDTLRGRASNPPSMSVEAVRSHSHVPLTLFRMGRYQKSLEWLHWLVGNGILENIHLEILNMFHLELYEEVREYCTLYLHLGDEYRLWSADAARGLLIYCNIKLGQHREARGMLKNLKRFNVNNPIIAYCAHKLQKTHFLYKAYNMEKDDRHFGIYQLFQAMIFQDQMKKYTTAILMYHLCNFYGLHLIHYYRMYQCYLKLGLYHRALRCLVKAAMTSDGDVTNVPSIDKRYAEKKQRVIASLRKLQCDTCEGNYSDTFQLMPCCGCLEVYYCSKSCQKIGWKYGHRNKCNLRFLGFKQKLKMAQQRSPFL